MSASTNANNLDELRSLVDEIDAEIIGLLAKRFAATDKIGAFKARAGIAAVDPEREERQRVRYTNLASKYDLSETLIQTIFRVVISEVVANHTALASNCAE